VAASEPTAEPGAKEAAGADASRPTAGAESPLKRSRLARPLTRLEGQALSDLAASGLVAIACALSIWQAFRFVGTYADNAPFLDQWDPITLFTTRGINQVSFGDLWAQNGENRMLFPKLLMLGLAHLTHYDVVAEVYVFVGALVVVLAVLLAAVRHTFGGLSSLAAVVPILLFYPRQWENFIPGIQDLPFAIFLPSALLAFLLVAARQEDAPSLDILIHRLSDDRVEVREAGAELRLHALALRRRGDDAVEALLQRYTFRIDPGITDEKLVTKGTPVASLPQNAKTLAASYFWPMQSHASLGPSCAVADVRPDQATIWTASPGTRIKLGEQLSGHRDVADPLRRDPIGHVEVAQRLRVAGTVGTLRRRDQGHFCIAACSHADRKWPNPAGAEFRGHGPQSECRIDPAFCRVPVHGRG